MEKLREMYRRYQGRIPKFKRSFLWFPDLLCKREQLYNTLIMGKGPLELSWRLFIAIMVTIGIKSGKGIWRERVRAGW